VLTIFGQRISGAHYNPALSIAQMLRKDAGNFPRLLALAYIVAQILGAFAGALVSWFLLGDFRSLYAIEMPDDNSPVVIFGKIISDSGNIYPMCKYTSDEFKKEETGDTLWYKHECSAATWVVAAMLTEVLGSFFLSFFFLTQTEEKTRFGKDKAINCFIIAASYVGARSMLNGKNVTFSGAVLNPAISIGTNFTMLFDKGASYF
jgi:glycerol uptake facilitator-like aquaporin